MIQQLIPLGIFIPVLDSLRVSLQTNQSSVGGWEGGFLCTCTFKPVQLVFNALWQMQPIGLSQIRPVLEFVFKYVRRRRKFKFSFIYIFNNFYLSLYFTIASWLFSLRSLHFLRTPITVINHSGDAQTKYSIIMANNCFLLYAHQAANTCYWLTYPL